MSFIDDFPQIFTSNTRLSSSYSFNPSSKTILVSDFDLVRVLLVLNSTDNTVIYNPLSSAQGGTVNGMTINLDYDTTSMDKSDDLIVVYEYFTNNEITTQLNKLIELNKEQLKFLKKIYN